MSFARRCLALLAAAALAGCGEMTADLTPSGTDQRPGVEAGAEGPAVGERGPGFTLRDTRGNVVSLAEALASAPGVVLYFTMWCSTCDTHMSRLREFEIPAHPDVRFIAVDYVSATFEDARRAEISNGYDGSPFTVLADTEQGVLRVYGATMGTVVVVDNAGLVRMNEDYKDGFRLGQALDELSRAGRPQ